MMCPAPLVWLACFGSNPSIPFFMFSIHLFGFNSKWTSNGRVHFLLFFLGEMGRLAQTHSKKFWKTLGQLAQDRWFFIEQSQWKKNWRSSKLLTSRLSHQVRHCILSEKDPCGIFLIVCSTLRCVAPVCTVSPFKVHCHSTSLGVHHVVCSTLWGHCSNIQSVLLQSTLQIVLPQHLPRCVACCTIEACNTLDVHYSTLWGFLS